MRLANDTRHSPLFTLRSGQSGLGIYTTARDAARGQGAAVPGERSRTERNQDKDRGRSVTRRQLKRVTNH
jgi:hypothetical protein